MSTVALPQPARAAAQAAPKRPVITGDEQRIAIRGLGWDLYDRLSDAIGEGQHVRLAYDGKDLEILTTGRFHEDFKELLGLFVNAIADDLRIPRRGAGQTTWKRPEVERGIEADLTYYFLAEKLRRDAEVRMRRSQEIADSPNPDLAIEIDTSPPQVDRPSIYRALQVAEIWRFDGESLRIDQLGPDGKYVPAESSRFLPIRAEEVVRWVAEEDTDDLAAWRGRLREWVQVELPPGMVPARGKKPHPKKGGGRRPPAVGG